MNNEQILIPEGWTYFAHRTNTEKWNDTFCEGQVIIVKGMMSVISEEKKYTERNQFGSDYVSSYNRGEGTMFEIRTLICGLPYLSTLKNENEMKRMMIKEFYYDKRNADGEMGRRHPSIPPEEELVVIKISDYDEVYEKEEKIIWTIPRRFMEMYINNINNNGYRVIDLNPQKRSTKGL